MNIIIKVFFGLVLVIALYTLFSLTPLFSFIEQKFFAQSAKVTNTAQTPTVTLAQSNEDFVLAQGERKDGQLDAALASYGRALVKTQDPTLEAQVKYYIAAVAEQKGEYVKAISLYKEIAATGAYPPIFKAYSVQQIALMHYTYFDRASADAILAETFKDLPYSSFSAPGYIDLTYRRLFEYAASFYPLGTSESRIAVWYTKDLLDTLKGATTTANGIAHVARIEDAISKVDADITRTKDDPVANSRLPEMLAAKGLVLGKLFSLGIGSDQAAESAFQYALQFAAVKGAPPGNINAYFYAGYLANQYGSTRAEDIKKLLSGFSASHTQSVDVVSRSYLTALTSNSSLVSDKKKAVLLAGLDSDFKSYLISLGWNEKDFVIATRS